MNHLRGHREQCHGGRRGERGRSEGCGTGQEARENAVGEGTRIGCVVGRELDAVSSGADDNGRGRGEDVKHTVHTVFDFEKVGCNGNGAVTAVYYGCHGSHGAEAEVGVDAGVDDHMRPQRHRVH